MVGSEALSKVISRKDRSTCVIFGDCCFLISDNQPGIFLLSDSENFYLVGKYRFVSFENGDSPYVKGMNKDPV